MKLREFLMKPTDTGGTSGFAMGADWAKLEALALLEEDEIAILQQVVDLENKNKELHERLRQCGCGDV